MVTSLVCAARARRANRRGRSSSMSMLGEIVAGEAEGLILIQDSASCEGRTLLKSFVAAAAQRGESVHVLSFEVPEEDFKAGFGPEVTSRILFHDGFQDPLGWIGQEGALTVAEFSAAELVSRLALASQGPVTVVLDSLSWLLLHLPLPLLCQVLVQLPRQAKTVGLSITRLVVLLHGDLHQLGQLAALHALARAVVMLELAPEAIFAGEGTPQAAVMLHRKKRSKVLQKKEYFSVLAGFALKHISAPPQDPDTRAEKAEDSKAPPVADPADNLTFNLRLSEAERQAKESVPLPYHFSEEKKSSLLQVPTSQGKIYYEPDAADDIDEEDPDDDLDV